MQIVSNHHRSYPPGQSVNNIAKAQATVNAEPQLPVDQLLSNRLDIDTDPVSLPDSPPPALERPVLFLHGFNGSATRWGDVFDWLTSGDKPVNRSGGIVEAGKFQDLDPKANLFSVKFSRPYNSVETNKSELRATVDAVLAATGAKEVDLVVHSLGGLVSRSYLQDSDEKVNKLVMIGTPNHGSQLANTEKFFRKNFDFPIVPPVDDPEVRRVLDQLSVDTLDKNKTPNNPWLRDLNNDWESQKNAAEVLIVHGVGIPTLTAGPGLTVYGDGVTSRASAKLDGVSRKTIWFKTHGGLQNSPKVMENTAKFLTGAEMDKGENLFDSPEDALRATELVLGRTSNPTPPVQRASFQEARQANRLPLLDPAFQMGLALGVLSSVMGGPKESLPLIEIGLRSNSQDDVVDANYNIDLMRKGNQLQGSGVVNGQPFAEVADFQEGKVQWTSALGLNASGLTLEVGEDEKSVTMKGSMGGVPTDLKIDLLLNEAGNMSGILTHGTFNDEAYSMRSSVDMAGLLYGGGDHQGEMHMTGVVNGEDVERKYVVDVKKNNQGLEFRASSDKREVDDQSVGVSVKVINRD